MSRATITAALLLLVPAAPATAQTRAEVREARTLMQSATTAMNAGNHAEARSLLERAAMLRPRHPALLYNLARAAAAGGDMDTAARRAAEAAALGLQVNFAGDPVMNGLREAERIELTNRFAANAAATEKSSVAFRLERSDLLAEGIAHDPRTRSFFIGAVHANAVLRIDSSGAVTTFADSASGLAGVFGMAVDSARRRLFVTTSSVPEAGAAAGRAGFTALHVYDADNGRLLAAHAPPSPLEGQLFGDVTIDAATGDAYISDTGAGVIYRLGASGNGLEPLNAQGTLDSPQGLVHMAAQSALVIADYSSGLWKMDLRTRRLTQLRANVETHLLGLDALQRHGSTLIAIQNYPAPHRVLRLTLSTDLEAVYVAEVLESRHPLFREPTLGVTAGDAFYYIANSQWARFDASYRGTRDEVIVLRLDLTR